MKSILKISNTACFKLLIAVIALSWTSTAIFAQNLPATQTPEQFLRELYFRGDNFTAERDALALAAKPGASLETRAWYIGLAKSYDLLDGMEREAPQDADLRRQNFLGYRYGICDRSMRTGNCQRSKGRHFPALFDRCIVEFLEAYRRVRVNDSIPRSAQTEIGGFR
jgi:hypothetical protein